MAHSPLLLQLIVILGCARILELVMKVGLDAGLIGKPLFTMLLIMAIVTSVMTGPLLNLFMRHRPKDPKVASPS